MQDPGHEDSGRSARLDASEAPARRGGRAGGGARGDAPCAAPLGDTSGSALMDTK